jgi:hypothetical protein
LTKSIGMRKFKHRSSYFILQRQFTLCCPITSN